LLHVIVLGSLKSDVLDATPLWHLN
jgi:hypothetical protein